MNFTTGLFVRAILAMSYACLIAFAQSSAAEVGSNSATSREFENGSFESPGASVLSTKNYLLPDDKRLTGWLVGGSGGLIALYNAPVPSEVFPAKDGNSHILFNGGGGAPGTWIAQTFKTEVGTKYVVNFYVGRLGGGSGTLSVTVSLKASNGETLESLRASPPAEGYGSVQELRFTAKSRETTLEIFDTSSGELSSQDITVDGVTVIPEPGLVIRVSSFEICWPSEKGKSYQVQYSTSVADNQWYNLGGIFSGDGNRQCLTDVIPAGSSKRFYRLITTP